MASVVQNIKNHFGTLKDLSLNNQYQVNISGLSGFLSKYLETDYGLDADWISNNLGILCSDATLPTSSFATAEVKDNFQGINQQFAHTKLYVDSDFTFYIDSNYKVIRFFEGWMSYISGDNITDISQSRFNRNYTRRFNYPQNDFYSNGYKIDSLTITKFERSLNNSQLTYKFINAFPKSMTSIPVQYGNADILRVTVSFAYDRYILENPRGTNKANK